ncbi:hypothetical protein MAR_015333 [Mya arenaria]|uniref:Uncharacterized protein n=1 Tax=Mya arenaria TaxID=6604 RepID=A0ABY7FJ54_MYAAR|nr:hypothetical protein MAR_015333 [Mya arenaria]
MGFLCHQIGKVGFDTKLDKQGLLVDGELFRDLGPGLAGQDVFQLQVQFLLFLYQQLLLHDFFRLCDQSLLQCVDLLDVLKLARHADVLQSLVVLDLALVQRRLLDLDLLVQQSKLVISTYKLGSKNVTLADHLVKLLLLSHTLGVRLRDDLEQFSFLSFLSLNLCFECFLLFLDTLVVEVLLHEEGLLRLDLLLELVNLLVDDLPLLLSLLLVVLNLLFQVLLALLMQLHKAQLLRCSAHSLQHLLVKQVFVGLGLGCKHKDELALFILEVERKKWKKCRLGNSPSSGGRQCVRLQPSNSLIEPSYTYSPSPVSGDMVSQQQELGKQNCESYQRPLETLASASTFLSAALKTSRDSKC